VSFAVGFEVETCVEKFVEGNEDDTVDKVRLH
jgi:hypothetical protein